MDFFFLNINKVDINYFLIIQDVVGILILLVGLKLSVLYFLYIIRHGDKLKNIICFIGSIILMFSGLNLVFFNKGLLTWIISLVLIIISSLFGRLAYRKL